VIVADQKEYPAHAAGLFAVSSKLRFFETFLQLLRNEEYKVRAK
jgi:hypothetical protein